MTAYAPAPLARPAQQAATFTALGLPQSIVDALRRRAIIDPFPIQTATIPDALTGRDVLARAATGTGKTLAFGLPTIARLALDRSFGRRRPRSPRALVLVPTRELAFQVSDALAPIAAAVGVRTHPIVGGAPYGKQAHALARGVDLVVATPGRLTDHVGQETVDLSSIEIVVLDEADEMADMGFLPQVRTLLDLLPAKAQHLLFSATLDRAVDTLIRDYLDDPVRHSLAPATASVETMDHHLFKVAHAEKLDVAAQIANRPGRTILFVRTKHGADRLVGQLGKVGVTAGGLHGGKTQGARNRAMAAFRSGHVPVLVATDVAARGVHVDGVSLVVHVDPPADPKSYLHRAGRTARAGHAGTVVTLVAPHQEREVRTLAKRAGIRPAWHRIQPGDAVLATLTGARQLPGAPAYRPSTDRAPGRGRPHNRRPRRHAA